MEKTLTAPIKNIHTVVRKEVVDVMREILSDPDAGLELTSYFVRRLRKSVRDKKAGKLTPLDKVFARYGV